MPFNEKIQELQSSIAKIRNSEKKIIGEGNGWIEIKPKRGRKPTVRIDFDVYPEGASIVDRFRYILQDAGRFLPISEVAERVKQYEPNEDITLIKTKFSRHIDKYIAKNELIKMSGGKTMLYGLPEWVDKDGIPLEKYKPLESPSIWENAEYWKDNKGGTAELF